MTIIIPEWIVGVALAMWVVTVALNCVTFYYRDVKRKPTGENR